MTTTEIKERLEYLRGEIRGERISYGEIAELQDLAAHINPDDVELLEWAGVEESERFNRHHPECDGLCDQYPGTDRNRCWADIKD